MSITPRALAELLGSAGYPVTERRLTDWRAKRWIPDVCRGERPPGTGRGAHYEWQDGEIVAQVFTLLNMLDLRGRMESASLFAWFCGFDMPRSDTRELWIGFERLPWDKALRWAHAQGLDGWEGSQEEDVETLVREELLREARLGYSGDFLEIFHRFGVDPAFDVRKHLPIERIEEILAGDDVRRFTKQDAEILALVSADVVRGLAVLVQDYWSRPRWIEVIQGIPDDMLTKAHADVRFLLTPYRRWVESSVRSLSDGDVSDYREAMLWYGPRLVWRFGRFLMQLDIALRRLGYGDEVDATIALLRDVAAKDETREVVRAFKEYWRFVAPLHDKGLAAGELSRLADEFMARSGDDAVRDHAMVIAQDIGGELMKLWQQPLGLALRAAAAEGLDDPELPATSRDGSGLSRATKL